MFQYIPCYCSTRPYYNYHDGTICFNTSHVTVQRMNEVEAYNVILFQYIPCYCSTHWYSIIIYPLSVFQYIPCYCSTVQESGGTVQVCTWFQYIPCYCSTNLKTVDYNFHVSFNTSHVTVQPMSYRTSPFFVCSFNTSHVTVQLWILIIHNGNV